MAALEAARRGHDVELIEKAPDVGGMSASFDIAGQRVDFGSHRLHPAAPPDILTELRELLGDDLQVRTRNGRIRLDGSWIGFPLRAADLIRNSPRRFSVRALRDVVSSPLRRPTDETFAGAVRAGLGPTVFDAFYGPYARKLWGVSADELDVSLARRRVSAGSPVDIARRLVRSRRSSGREFLYPRHGYGQVCERLAEEATHAGVRLRCGVGIAGVELDDAGVVVRLDGDESIEADVLLSSIPLAELARRTHPPPQPSALAAADRLEHRAMVFVYLVCDQPQYTEFDAHYFPSEDTPIARLSEPKNYRDGDDPPDQTVLCAEMACTVGDHIWSAADGELADLVVESLVEQGLPEPSLVHTETRRIRHVYPVYRVGYGDALQGLEEWVAQSSQLLSFGRQGLFVPDNMHHALVMGREAAAAVTDSGTIDHTRWRHAREAFRGHVVED